MNCRLLQIKGGALLFFRLSVPDLSPNLGVFWYFFTEMFEHFRSFFICVFQIHAFLYTVPLAVKLRYDPSSYVYSRIMHSFIQCHRQLNSGMILLHMCIPDSCIPLCSATGS